MTVSPKPDRPRYTLTVEDDGQSDTPAIIRLRAWLKSGLRRFGLRCIRIEKAPLDQQPKQHDTAPKE